MDIQTEEGERQIKAITSELIPVEEQEDGVHTDFVFKVIIIGDTRKYGCYITTMIGVGKSCILSRLMKNEFDSDHNVTIGVEFGNYMMRLNGKHVVKLQIWDTAGQESYRNITRIFYKGADAVVMVYSITDSESYENLRSWKTEIENNADKQNVISYLVGNMADLGDTDERQVTQDEGNDMMHELDCKHFLETSALTG